MAATITGPFIAAGSQLTQIDTVAQVPVGTVVAGKDSFGNFAEYIYLTGVASTIAGSVVTYDEAGLSTLLVTSALGPVAVALAATVASTYGWYARTGCFLVDMVASVADNAKLGYETASGKVGDNFTTGDQIDSMVSRGSTTGAALQYAQFDRPFASDSLGA